VGAAVAAAVEVEVEVEVEVGEEAAVPNNPPKPVPFAVRHKRPASESKGRAGTASSTASLFHLNCYHIGAGRQA
jgi:hypothetical protein